MTPVSNEPSLLDRICHKEQLGIWADEIASVLALGDFLKEDWTFDDSVDLSNEIAAQLRDIIGAALTHPEFNVTEALAARQSPEPSSSEVRVRKGWKLVPEEPTEEMRSAAMRHLLHTGNIYTREGEETIVVETYTTKAVYAAMLAAAPTLSPTVSQPVTGEEVERAIPDELIELLEWRRHGSHDLITHTEFGPYMVDRAGGGKCRAWLPDESKNARIMVEAAGDEKTAKALCQADLDGRRAVRMVRECSVYLTQGETPAQRIERERKDVGVVIEMLANERARAEAAEARLSAVEVALKPFAAIAEEYAEEEDDEFQVWKDFDILGASLPLKIFRRAREALSKAKEGKE